MGLKLLYFLNLVGSAIFHFGLTVSCILFLGLFSKKKHFPADLVWELLTALPVLFLLSSPIVIYFFPQFITQYPHIAFLYPWLFTSIILLVSSISAFRSGTSMLFIIILVWVVASTFYYFLYAILLEKLLNSAVLS